MPEGDLEAIEAVKRVKYAYFRLLDLKRFDELGAAAHRRLHRRL